MDTKDEKKDMKITSETEKDKSCQIVPITYGYARVSSRDQNEDRQIIALKEMGVPEKNISVDKQSGKYFERKQYKKLMKLLKADTVLFIKSIKATLINEAILRPCNLLIATSCLSKFTYASLSSIGVPRYASFLRLAYENLSYAICGIN